MTNKLIIIFLLAIGLPLVGYSQDLPLSLKNDKTPLRQLADITLQQKLEK